MVAAMTDLLELRPNDVVLEIGTGLGYQSAVLAELGSVEIQDSRGSLFVIQASDGTIRFD